MIIVIDGQRVSLRRPALPGAILLKARSLAVHSRPEDQRQDLILLLGLMADPRSAVATLHSSERRWLRDVGPALNLDDRDLDATIDPGRLRVARAAYRLLAGT